MKNFLLFLSLFIQFVPGRSQTGSYRLGIRINAIAPGEHFIVGVNRPGEEPYFLEIEQPGITYMPMTYPAGQQLFLQDWGGMTQRQCFFGANRYRQITIGNSDLVVDMDCGAPSTVTPSHPLTVRIPNIGEGEEFKLELFYGTREEVTLTRNLNQATFRRLFRRGDAVSVVWKAGPRGCNIEFPFMIADTNNLIICDCGAAPPAASGTRVGIRINTPPAGKTLHFQARKKNQQIATLEIAGPANLAYFPTNFNAGDTITISGETDNQMWCVPQGNAQQTYIIPNETLIIDASCGMHPYLKMGAMNAHETFSFEISNKDYPKDTVVVRSLAGPLAGTRTPFMKNRYYEGDTVRVRFISGPRLCSLPSYSVIFNGFNYIEATQLGSNDSTGAPPAKSRIAGTYSAPAGTNINIALNDGSELKLTAPGANSTGYGRTGFRFPKEYEGGTQFSISIKSTPANCKCGILPAASGITPADSLKLNIICSPSVELASRSSDDRVFNSFYETNNPVVGGRGPDEGRFIAFISSGAGIDGSSGKYRQLFMRDMRSGVTKLISRSPAGEEGNGDSFSPSISADGKSIAFESYATNFSGVDNNGVRDVYLWKEGGGVQLVSKGPGGAGNSESFDPSVNGDGSVIAFSSSASNLTPAVEGNSTLNVYLADGGSIQLLSKDIKTKKGVGGSAPHISADGSKVVFCSYSSAIAQNDNNGLWDIFLWQRGNLPPRRISLTATGQERDQGTESASRVVWASISGNGNYIVYSTTATNMVTGDNNKLQDIFICDIGGGSVRRLSVTAGNLEGNGDSPVDQGGRVAISDDGNWISYNTSASNLGVAKGNIILQHTRTGKIIPVTNSVYNTTGRPMISSSGAYVVAGCSEKLDSRFPSSGIFSFFTGNLLQ